MEWKPKRCQGIEHTCTNEPVLCRMCSAEFTIKKVAEERERCAEAVRKELQSKIDEEKKNIENLRIELMELKSRC